ncbi:hypothetical protein AAMO2058_000214200 [Amorphochlora amoebiformis]|uniref:Uncharacterized protein n=1 Tax=Amorphochlora amoebiformis TaxID=1561963 RepID=A0A7S0CTY0_9EUKA|mmetsp:Transcript_13730/g.21731  ORF Transcript_13730/g.21731 Transcript_13730/m.21731 type:complete len:301 (+) Transcript_13730:2-904(+)
MGSKSSKVSRQKALDEFWRRVRSRELERAVKWIDDHNIDLYDEVDSEREWDAVQWGAYLGDHNFLTAMLDIYQLRCDTHIPDTKIEKFGVSRGATPLHLAAERGNARSIEVLIKKGNADPNPINTHGYSPLHTAALKQRHKSVISLLKCKADVNSSLKYTNNNPNQRLTFTRGSTALHLAIKLNLKRITRILLIYGGDGKYEDDQGLTPDQAAEIGPRSFWDYYSREKEIIEMKVAFLMATDRDVGRYSPVRQLMHNQRFDPQIFRCIFSYVPTSVDIYNHTRPKGGRGRQVGSTLGYRY